MSVVGQSRRWVLLKGAAVLAWLGGGSTVSAATVNTITFDSPTDFTNNFVGTLNGSSVVYNSTGQNLVYTAATAGGTSIIRYDTNPADGQPGPADFLAETLKADFTPDTVTNSASTGLFTRIQSAGAASATGVLALLNTISATSVQLRLFYGANASSTAAGTTFFDGTFNLTTGSAPAGAVGSTNTIFAGKALTLTLTETAATDPVFNLTVSNANGLVASTGDRTLLSSATDAFDTAGSVAIRVNGPAQGNTIAIDNFSATPTPEPGSVAAIALAGVTAIGRRRRRR
jgi:MYXO-CTERM domain-containing protein